MRILARSDVRRLRRSPILVTGLATVVISAGVYAAGTNTAPALLVLLIIPLAWSRGLLRSRSLYWWLGASCILAAVILVTALDGALPASRAFWTTVAGVVLVTAVLPYVEAPSVADPVTDSSAEGRLSPSEGDLGILRRVLASQEEERQRIGRELHDHIGQLLTALKYHLECVETAPTAQLGQQRPNLEAARKILDQGFDELHRVVLDLRPQILDDLGLVPAIRYYAREFFGNMDISVRIVSDEIGRIAGDKETGLFRIAQEALTNVVRHADASEVTIRIQHVDSRSIRLEVEDNGRGFTPDEDGPTGMGLRGMSERAEIMGGTCSIQSRILRGSRILVTVPP